MNKVLSQSSKNCNEINISRDHIGPTIMGSQVIYS